MVRIVAHRGASATRRENTLDAFRVARQEGAAGIELDVRRARSDVLVVHHDANLADGRRLSRTSADELPDWVPTLSQALDESAGMWVNVEIKNMPDDPDYDAENAISLAVAGLLTAHILAEIDLDSGSVDEAAMFRKRVLVSSFNPQSLLRIREMNAAIPLGLLVWGQGDPVSLVGRAQAYEVQAIHPHDLLVDASFVKRAKDAGLEINVWTVDDPTRIVELTKLGVDGIITNRPGFALETLANAGLGD